jgi:hypothetical protein
MRKISQFIRGSESLPVVPQFLAANFISVGPSKCDYTSLADAIAAAPAFSNILVLPGNYKGPFLLKSGQNIFFLGLSTLYSENNQLLFNADCDDWNERHPERNEESITDVVCTVGGTTPILNPSRSDTLIDIQGDYYRAHFHIHGLFAERTLYVGSNGNTINVSNIWNSYELYSNCLKWGSFDPQVLGTNYWSINFDGDNPGCFQVNYLLTINPLSDDLVIKYFRSADVWIFDWKAFNNSGTQLSNSSFLLNVKKTLMVYKE